MDKFSKLMTILRSNKGINWENYREDFYPKITMLPVHGFDDMNHNRLIDHNWMDYNESNMKLTEEVGNSKDFGTMNSCLNLSSTMCAVGFFFRREPHDLMFKHFTNDKYVQSWSGLQVFMHSTMRFIKVILILWM